MLKKMHRISKLGREWHVEVYQTFGNGVRLHKIYTLNRNDGAGPRSFKRFISFMKAHNDIATIPLPKKFSDAMLAWVQMRGET